MNSAWLRATLVATAIFGAATAQCSTFANSPSGTNLALTDESVRTVALPFAFPFRGVSYSAITVSSNGFLWLGVGTTSEYWVSEIDALSAAPRIMPQWWDLDPASLQRQPAAGVYCRIEPLQASVTWKGVPTFRNQTVPVPFAQFECVLEPSGRITFRYDTTHGVAPVVTLAGITAGHGAAPDPRVWSNDLPGPTLIRNGTGYQVFAPNTANLSGRTLTFTPRALPPGNFDFDVVASTLPTCPPGSYPPLAGATPTTIGTGCPATVQNGAIYQSFYGNAQPGWSIDLANTSLEFVRTGDTYTLTAGPGLDPAYLTSGTPMAMTDDQVIPGLTVGPMGVFPFGSQTHATIAACANGYVWLSSAGLGDFTPTTSELLSFGPRLAPLWMDHDPGAGGTFYWENSDPTFCRATFHAFVQRSHPGIANTFQLTLRSNGNIVFSYGASGGAIGSLNTVVAVVGISGGAAEDRFGTDLAIAGAAGSETRRITGAVAAMVHTVGFSPRIGQVLSMSATVPPANFGLGMFAIGSSNPAAPLDALFAPGAAPGCSIHTDLQWVGLAPFPAGATSFELALPVPYDLALTGLTVFSQAAAFASVNAAGVATSNGLQMTTGI